MCDCFVGVWCVFGVVFGSGGYYLFDVIVGVIGLIVGIVLVLFNFGKICKKFYLWILCFVLLIVNGKLFIVIVLLKCVCLVCVRFWCCMMWCVSCVMLLVSGKFGVCLIMVCWMLSCFCSVLLSNGMCMWFMILILLIVVMVW